MRVPDIEFEVKTLSNEKLDVQDIGWCGLGNGRGVHFEGNGMVCCLGSEK